MIARLLLISALLVPQLVGAMSPYAVQGVRTGMTRAKVAELIGQLSCASPSNLGGLWQFADEICVATTDAGAPNARNPDSFAGFAVHIGYLFIGGELGVVMVTRLPSDRYADVLAFLTEEFGPPTQPTADASAWVDGNDRVHLVRFSETKTHSGLVFVATSFLQECQRRSRAAAKPEASEQ